MTREEAHQLIDNIFDASEEAYTPNVVEAEVVEEPERELPEGKRVVRTKSSGDRVYYLNDTVTPKTRQWVTNPDVLKGLGFEGSNVIEVDDSELLKYTMAAAIYKVDEQA